MTDRTDKGAQEISAPRIRDPEFAPALVTIASGTNQLASTETAAFLLVSWHQYTIYSIKAHERDNL